MGSIPLPWSEVAVAGGVVAFDAPSSVPVAFSHREAGRRATGLDGVKPSPSSQDQTRAVTTAAEAGFHSPAAWDGVGRARTRAVNRPIAARVRRIR